MTLWWVEVRLVGSHSDRGGGVVGRQVQLALRSHRDQALRVHLCTHVHEEVRNNGESLLSLQEGSSRGKILKKPKLVRDFYIDLGSHTLFEDGGEFTSTCIILG